MELSGSGWEDRALSGIAGAARLYDVTEYKLGLVARCGSRLKRPRSVMDGGDDGAVLLIASRPSGTERAAGPQKGAERLRHVREA